MSIEDAMELVLAKCDCCGLTEECTQAYIDSIRQRYDANFFCGLCGEAVNDEIARTQMITTEEAMVRHINFCQSPRTISPALHLIDAMKQILRRAPTSTPNSPLRSAKSIRISRSESCMLTLALQSSSSYTDLQEIIKS